MLYILKGTPLAQMFENKDFRCLEREEFAEIAVDFLELLPPWIVIQRLTGDPPLTSELLSPKWALEKSENLNLIRQLLERRNTWQGKRFKKSFVGT